jgi:hypothetical protein
MLKNIEELLSYLYYFTQQTEIILAVADLALVSDLIDKATTDEGKLQISRSTMR